MESEKKTIIFYGAGSFAREIIDRLIINDIIPVCFADEDKNKHYKKIAASGIRGGVEILPLQEAITRYPNYEIIMTVNTHAFDEVRNYLIQRGISPKNIRPILDNYANQCSMLGTYMVFDSGVIRSCCFEHNFNFPSSGNLKEDIEMYIHSCKKIAQDLNDGKTTSCSGCPALGKGPYNENLEITTVNISSLLPGGTNCNLKCTYCVYEKDMGNPKFDYNVLELLQYLIEIPTVKFIQYGCGEITVSPYKDEILNLWKQRKFRGTILTNASIYNPDIADLLHQGLISINVSLDAGNADTYEKVKGVRCFDKVVENLDKYAQSGAWIELKYILLRGQNTDEKNIDGFLEVAERIQAQVFITRDYRLPNYTLSEIEYSMLLYIVQGCRQRGMAYKLIHEWSPTDIQRLIRDKII